MKKAASIMVLVVLAATLLTACSDSTTGSAAVSGSTKALSIAGGEGTVGNGGSGGTFKVKPFDNTLVKINRSGSVDTSVDTAYFDGLLSSASFTTGAVPLDVAANMTISTYPTGTDTGVAESEYHLHVGDTNMYKLETGVDVMVTGIRVHPGVTLTLGLNFNNNYTCPVTCDTGFDTAQISVNNNIWNQGTITTMDLVAGKDDALGSVTNVADGTALDKGSLEIRSYEAFLNDGMITTRGTDTTLAAGGWAGNISVWADIALVNRGAIDSSGGSGMDGGMSGSSSLRSGYGILNTGPVNAKGGTGTDGEGGWGSRITAETGTKIDTSYAWQSLLYNSGTLNSSGGDGTGGGGEASGSTLYAGAEGGYACGAFVNSGNLIGNGGSATTMGSGGTGANYWNADSPHDLGAYGCNLLNSGAIEFKGGAGKGAGSWGGDGGELYVWTAMNYDYDNNVVAPGSILFGGSVLADGGSGETGGSGGYAELSNYVYLQVYNDNGYYVYATNSGSIEVLGYNAVNLKGGKGATDGGIGGYSEIYWDISDYNSYNTVNADNYNGFIVTPSSIYNDADFDISGGQGVAGNGGRGGYFNAEMRNDYLFWNWWKPGSKSTLPAPGSIENRGNITTKGGQGALIGGDAGYNYYYYDNGHSYYDDDISIFMFASGNVTNTGVLDASGGQATDAAGTGGYGYPVVLDALGNSLNSGSITVSGGNGKTTGGGASWVQFYSDAGTNINTAAITATGGNANAVGGNGGGGGSIYIYTNHGPLLPQNAGTLSVTGGTGEFAGGDGSSYVDWY